ncbi:substrate-binding domain-containing protein [Pararobbsia silviterrae]|uniref:D-ribose ABC transporter substrate-binding protein n=1 Tax=Pararobbsia silviterrae TaxID=1792498 RepID=A0A494Y4V0_9BURK|nr:substrate-binding domain-containing protein [Pararobbsia silviterrae]RKP57736.1 D-ribose ABC transporter substrate-binding protein [Pararobbsia silviterrae]
MSRKIEFGKGLTRRDVLRLGITSAAAALGSSFIQTSAWGETGVEGKTIGFSMSYSNLEWIKLQQAGVEETAKKYNLKTVVYDATDQPTKEIQNLEDLITRGVDAILISTYYADAIRPAIKEINNAGIPIIVLSSPLAPGADFACHLATDTLGTARQAGEFYVKKLGGKGNIVEIDGKPGSLINQQRGKGWHDVIDKVPGIKVVSHLVANYDRQQALKVMEDALQANSGIDAVFAHNDDMALGAIQAAREAGRLKSMMFTGFDGLTIDALQAIDRGELTATWEYSPFGVEAVEAAVRVLQKKPIQKVISFPSPLITKDNLADYYDAAAKKRRVLPSRLTFS